MLFDVRDLLEGCVEAQPHLFGPVEEVLYGQLTQAEGASADGGGGAADGAAHGAGDDGGSDPFQRLALFSLDAPSGEPRQSLVAALEMLSGVVPAIGGSAREAEALSAERHAYGVAGAELCRQLRTENRAHAALVERILGRAWALYDRVGPSLRAAAV